MTIASAASMLAFLASGIVVGTSVGVTPAGAAEKASKAAFCGANDALDRASANVNSASGFLSVLKTHKHDLAIMKKEAPSGALGQAVLQAYNAAEQAISTNNPNALSNVPSGAGIDTYCGVAGNGKPLPSNFAKGKTTSFCSTFVPIYQAAGNATSQAGVLSALTADQAQVNQLATELSTLPKSIKAKATAAVDNAQKAITTKNASALGGGNGNGPASYVALYCGQNQ